MFRAYWGIIAAIAGLVLLGAAEVPRLPAKAEQQQTTIVQSEAALSAVPVVTEATKIIEAPQKKEPCVSGRYSSSDDLCAQWKAADAARDAANWTWWQLWLSALGVLGLGATLWFNFRALRLAEGASRETKDALAIAERNADAATSHVRVAEDTAKRQLRAYLNIKRVKISDFDNFPLRVDVQIVNHGQTPAYDLQHYFLFLPLPFPAGKTHPPSIEECLPILQKNQGSQFPNAPVAKGEMAFAGWNPSLGVPAAELEAKKKLLFGEVQGGRVIVHVLGRVIYRDAYGDEHTSDYHVYIGDDIGIRYTIIDGERIVAFAYWAIGNDAD